MKKIYVLGMAALVAGGSYACKKKDDTKPTTNNPPEKVCYLAKEQKQGSINSLTWGYDINNRLSTLVRADSKPEEAYSNAYTYTSDGKLEKIEKTELAQQRVTERYTYDYSGTQLTKVHMFTVNGASSAEQFYGTYTYTGSNATKFTVFDATDNSPMFYLDMQYDAANRVTKLTRYEYDGTTPMLASTLDLTYDDKKVPYTAITGLFNGNPQVENMDEFMGIVLKNNITRATFKDETGAVDSDLKYTYKYNSDNLPTERVLNDNGQLTTTTLTYNCK